MFICAECLHAFERADRHIDRETYEEIYCCPVCGSDNIEFVRKDDANDKSDERLER